MVDVRLLPLRSTTLTFHVALDHQAQCLSDNRACGCVAARRNLIADMPDKGFGEGHVEGMFGSHGGPYQITYVGVTHLRVRFRDTAP